MNTAQPNVESTVQGLEIMSEAATALSSLRQQPSSFPRTGKRGSPQAFARKLFSILHDEPQAIDWSGDGETFSIVSMERFTADVLNVYFKHSNLSSFQRQLNLYGFAKVLRGANAGHYHHACFRRGRDDLLDSVRRKPQIKKKAAAGDKNAAAAGGGRRRASSGSASPPPLRDHHPHHYPPSTSGDEDPRGSSDSSEEDERSAVEMTHRSSAGGGTSGDEVAFAQSRDDDADARKAAESCCLLAALSASHAAHASHVAPPAPAQHAPPHGGGASVMRLEPSPVVVIAGSSFVPPFASDRKSVV